MGQRDSDYLRFREAIDHFRIAHDLWQQSIDQFGSSPGRQSLLATIELYACRAYRRSQRYDLAFQSGMRAESIFRSLWAQEPDQLLYGAQLQLASQELGLAYLDMRKPAEAIAEFAKARQTLKALSSNPGCQVSQAVHFKGLLAEVDYNVKVATDSDTVGFARTRREVIEEAYEIYDKLSFVWPVPLRVQRIYADVCFNKAVYQEQDGLQPDLGLLRKSAKMWDEFNSASPGAMDARGFLVIVRRKLAEVLESRGEPEEAAHWRALSLTTARGDADLLFEIGLEYARMLAQVDRLPLRLDASQRTRLRKSLADDTIALLREAVAVGFKDAGRLRSEPLLTPFRTNAAYQALLAAPELPRDVFAP